MKQNKLIITIAILLILTVVAFMAVDFFKGKSVPEKNIYEYNLDSLKKVDATLISYNEIRRINPDIEKMKAVAVDINDNIYVAGRNKLKIFEKEGKLLKEIVTGSDVLSMTIDDSNRIWLGARDHIEVWDTDGNQISCWETINEKVIITSIAITGSSVYVADAGNKIIYHYNTSGELLNNIGRKDSTTGIQGFIIPSPYFDLAIGRDDELWAVNSGRHQFEAYAHDGRQISSWKKSSMGLDGFSGCCNPSNFVILPNGSFVTSEKGIIRVKIHSPSGEFKTVVASPDQFEKGTVGLDLAVDSNGRILVLDPKKGVVRIFTEKINNN